MKPPIDGKPPRREFIDDWTTEEPTAEMPLHVACRKGERVPSKDELLAELYQHADAGQGGDPVPIAERARRR